MYRPYCRTIEFVLEKALTSFIVFSAADRNLLNQLCRASGFKDYELPQISIRSDPDQKRYVIPAHNLPQ